MDQQRLELNYLVPTVSSDGNAIFINTKGDVPTIMFFQVRKQDGPTIYADVAAAVRLDSLEDLMKLRDAIDETIEKHEKREK